MVAVLTRKRGRGFLRFFLSSAIERLPMIIISPEQFKEVILSVVEDRGNEAKLTNLWNRQGEYTNFMLRTLLPDMADKLKLQVYTKDYYLIDSIFYDERNTVDFPNPNEVYAKYIAIAFEHEHNMIDAHIEINRLSIYNTPLKVLVTYPGNKYRNDHYERLEVYSRIMKLADIFSDFSTQKKQLVILGDLRGMSIKWDFYVYKDGRFIKT